MRENESRASLDESPQGIESEIDRSAVLVVDDEALIRMGIIGELEDAGFQVFEADNADAAILELVANPLIGVLFTDVTMPGTLDGLSLAALVWERWPHVTVILTSGHHTLEGSAIAFQGRFIQKPYDAKQVIEAVIPWIKVSQSGRLA